jgi:hypothetical protein
VAIPARDPFLAYLRDHATLLNRGREALPAAAEHLAERAHAFELLAELVRSLPEDDERLLLLGTLAVRNGQFRPGPATEHALTEYQGASREACDAFLTSLTRVARDDALERARAHGHLPPRRPR